MQVWSSLATQLQPNECLGTPHTYMGTNNKTINYTVHCTGHCTAQYTLPRRQKWLAEPTYWEKNISLPASCKLFITVLFTLY